MDKLKQYIALTVVACLAILAAAGSSWSRRSASEAAELRAQADDPGSANAAPQPAEVLQGPGQGPAQAAGQAGRGRCEDPGQPGLPALIRALTAASTVAGVELVSVTPGCPPGGGSCCAVARSALPRTGLRPQPRLRGRFPPQAPLQRQSLRWRPPASSR